MTSESRKLKRKQKKKAEQELKKRLATFGKMGSACNACQKPFDNKSREHVETWNVVVREEKAVRLYCPDCWGMAKKLVKQVMEKTNDN
tara:strand:+ start:297 stop:560 length:264 start_codon:yes stop_codon:yes gene_type:complete